MAITLFDPQTTKAEQLLLARDYQDKDHAEAFRLWDGGAEGVLTRAFTGAGKSIMAIMKIMTWLRRGTDYRAMIVSYEKQLVWQLSQEVEEFTGITPGIEMEKERVHPDRIPLVTVACRASLLRSSPPEPAQIEQLKSLGIADVGACGARHCHDIIRELRSGTPPDLLLAQIEDFNRKIEVADGFYSRIHKFDWRLNWLVVYDEAHRHAHHLTSVGHIVDWFGRNPKSRRYGITATPKRGDDVSIGDKMFPAIALDYPLYSPTKPCGVKDGWAVPYVQKYIEVEGVDFKSIKKTAGDFDADELERILGEEAALARLAEPLLDMVGERQTLIFSPTVEMSKNVALYINARVPAACAFCGLHKWYAKRLIGDGAQCPCGQLVESSWVRRHGMQAEALWGDVAAETRRQVYQGYQARKFQFLSVCGLCREGFNAPDTACVAIFRPVSKKASSLAEQMKGRGCRPCRSIVKRLGVATNAEERLKIIAESEKPSCLIVDLVGITGLADCASTMQIYSEGLPDKVKDKAEALLLEKGQEDDGDAVDLEETIAEATLMVEQEDREKAEERALILRRQQEQFERRAKAQAEARYTAHDMGVGSQVDTNAATDGQYKFIARMGLGLHGIELTKRQATRIIIQLKLRVPLETIVRQNNIGEDQWSEVGPSEKTLKFMRWQKVPTEGATTGHNAGLLIDAKMHQEDFIAKMKTTISHAKDGDELTGAAMDVRLVRNILPDSVYQELVEDGRNRRRTLGGRTT